MTSIYAPVNSNPTRIPAEAMRLNLSCRILVIKGWDQ